MIREIVFHNYFQEAHKALWNPLTLFNISTGVGTRQVTFFVL